MYKCLITSFTLMYQVGDMGPTKYIEGIYTDLDQAKH
jgi:hypothetical protein